MNFTEEFNSQEAADDELMYDVCDGCPKYQDCPTSPEGQRFRQAQEYCPYTSRGVNVKQTVKQAAKQRVGQQKQRKN